VLIIALLSGCQTAPIPDDSAIHYVAVKEPLNRVNIVDHSGLSETITNPERLKELAQRQYLQSQPYRKVIRVYARNKEGTVHSIITTYYSNGQIQQYLECINGRARGLYQEWHENGQPKLLAHLLSGQADIDEKAFLTWSFDGVSQAWDDQGALSATFTYKQGALNGPAETFYSSGEKETVSTYDNGMKEGLEMTYAKNGQVLEQVTFHKGMRHGPATGYYENGAENWTEEYLNDHLTNAAYFAPDHVMLSSVQQGEGLRSVFDENRLTGQEEIHHGQPEGTTTIFDSAGGIERVYGVKNGKKNGVEIRYVAGTTTPKISIEWRDGIIHGTVKTWYPSGVLESQRELCQNAKQGVSMAWYPDGSLMLVEEYDNDKLIKGRYHRKGENIPASTIDNGKGLAMLFDASGDIIEKVTYVDGKPQIDE
jgi:antitoxin component YwqK of YwqJK toxin-antitoxin module